jgi:predicted metal-binding protein
MPVVPVKLVIDHSVRSLCFKPYERHPKGCPNYKRCDRCPPTAPLIERIIDLSRPVVAIYNAFPLGRHVEQMRRKHTRWTERQLLNCLYWQGTARRHLKDEIAKFHEHMLCAQPGLRYVVLTTPEACGVNVTETMRAAGVVLEWPARIVAHQVAIAGERVTES